MNKKTIIIITLLFLCVFISADFIFADKGLEVTYPEILGVEAPDSATSLPEFIKFIFNLSIALGGLLGFGALIYGGIKYIISAGNAGEISDAKAWIGGGFAGLSLLLATYLILTTINPNLVIFKKMEPLQSMTGICLYSADADDNELPCLGKGKKYYTLDNIPNIDISKFKAKSVKFMTPQNELISIFIFAEPNFTGEIAKIDNNYDGETSVLNINIPSDIIPASISFLKNKPGMYLYEKTNFCETGDGYICTAPPIYVSGTTDNLSNYNFNNRTKSIKIIHRSDKIINQTLLFSETGYMGVCSPIIGNPPTDTINNITLINDLSMLAVGEEITDEKKRGLYSIQSFTTNFSKKLSEATISFYDSIDCDDIEANRIEISPINALTIGNFADYNLIDSNGDEITKIIDGESKKINADKKVLSFKIEMEDSDAKYIPFVVILATKKLKETKNKDCQSFKLEKPHITNCVPTLKATSIYDTDDQSHRPSSFYILNIE